MNSLQSMDLQFSQYQHQSTPVPSTDKVCSALRYRNIDPLGRRHEYTGGFPHEVSSCQRQILDVCWWVHVSNAEVLQRSGLSTIGDILRDRRLSPFGHFHAWTLEYQHMIDAVRLRRQKANGQLEKTAGSPSQRLAQQGSGGYQRSTAVYAVET